MSLRTTNLSITLERLPEWFQSHDRAQSLLRVGAWAGAYYAQAPTLNSDCARSWLWNHSGNRSSVIERFVARRLMVTTSNSPR